MTMATLNIAVIGAGRIGQIHARNVAAHSAVQLAGIADPDRSAAERLAQATSSTTIALDDAFRADAVLICSPTTTHADYIERAAAAGKPVFCEKPIDLSTPRVRICLETVRRSGIPLMVGFNRRFDQHFAVLKRRLDEGEIGTLELLTIMSRDPSPPPLGYIATSGGLFRDMMIHDLDLARYFLGEEPVDVFAAASALVDPAIGAAGDVDTAVATLKTASGRLCQISNSRRATYGYDQRIELHGSKGLLRAGNVTATMVEYADGAGFRTDPALPFFSERYAESYRDEFDAFVVAVRTGSAPKPDGEDGLRALVLADAATESVRTGQGVRV
jgi:myo-inositol 2-dehydrogenase / D-chiro-inositol 1-dehydrogenase